MLNEAVEDKPDLRTVLEKYFLQVCNNKHCIVLYSDDSFKHEDMTGCALLSFWSHLGGFAIAKTGFLNCLFFSAVFFRPI